MTTGGKPKPVYVVTDAEIASGQFTVAPGPARMVASLDEVARGVSGGPSVPVYVVDIPEATRRGVIGGEAHPVFDMTSSGRSVGGLQKAIPVYVVLGSLGDAEAPPVVPPPSADPIYTNLVSWWALDEQSGVRYDAHGSNDLTDNNTVTFSSSNIIKGNSAVMVAANNEYLSSADDGLASDGDSFAFSFWADGSGSQRYFIARNNSPFSPTTSRDYEFSYTATFHAGFYVQDKFFSQAPGTDVYDAWSTTGWNYVAVWYDHAAGKLGIRINNKSAESVLGSVSSAISADPLFTIARRDYSTNAQVSCTLDEFKMWKGYIPTTAQLDWEYNSGAGRTYEQFYEEYAAAGLYRPDWWTEDGETVVAAYQPIGAATYGDALRNIANDGTYDLTPGVAPLWTKAAGFDFDGASYALNTNYIPPGTQSLSILARVTGGLDWDTIIGLYNVASSDIAINNKSSARYYYNVGVRSASGNFTDGVFGFAGTAAYKDGVADGTISTLTSSPNIPLYIGARNLGGTRDRWWAGKEQAIAIYSTTLDGTQVGDITDRMEALPTIPGQPLASSVLDNLSFYLTYDVEAAEIFYDETANHNDFSYVTNRPSAVAGKYGRGMATDANTTIKLDTNADISTGDVSWTMSTLIKHTGSLNGPLDSIAHMGDPGGGGNEWLLYYDSATPKTEFILYNGANGQVGTATINGALAADTWYWMAWGHNAVTGQLFLHVNQASSYVNTTGTPGTDAASDLSIGRADAIHISFQEWDGEFDETWFVREALSVADLTLLRNSNEGSSYFGFRNIFYGFSDAGLVPEESWRASGVASDLDITFPGVWTQVTGLRDDMRYQAGAFYPATVLSGYSGFYYDRIMDDDQWSSLTITDTASWANDVWMGMMVRCSTTLETFYAFLVEESEWKLISVVNGASETVLASNNSYTPVVGTRFDLKAEGTTISVDADGVEIASVTSASIASGRVGVICDGLDLDVKLSDFRCGDMPVGNMLIGKDGWIYNIDDGIGVTITDDCGMAVTPDVLFSQNFSVQDSHSVDEQHYVEIDFGEYRQIGGFRVYADSAATTWQLDSVTLRAKLDESDNWSTLFSYEDLSGALGSGPKPDVAGIRFDPFVCRYVLVQIHSTEDLNNYLSVMEWEFHG